MRKELLIHQIQTWTPKQTFAFLSDVLLGACKRNTNHLLVLDAVQEAILFGQKTGIFYENLTEVYRLAREHQREDLQRLLTCAKPQKEPVNEREVSPDPSLSNLTLGERKFLARGHNRFRLQRLLLDSDPSVLHNLLQNPKLVEQEVVGLAARRPTLDTIQKEIFQSRWGKRYRVRLALVLNPYTPTELSIKLVTVLLQKDLQLVKKKSNLHPLVREEAVRLLAVKKRKNNPPDHS